MEITSIKNDDFFNTKNQELVKYRLVIEPDIQVSTEIQNEREAFKKRYGETPVDDMIRYIKIADFLSNQAMEETLIRWIGRICRLQQSFILSLNNYGGFPQHSIYLRIQEMESLHGLFQQLKIIDSLISSSGGSSLKLAAKPHVVIAKQLPPEVYNKAVMDYAEKTFHESFEVNQLLLVKIDDAYETNKLVNVFGFTPAMNTLKI